MCERFGLGLIHLPTSTPPHCLTHLPHRLTHTAATAIGAGLTNPFTAVAAAAAAAVGNGPQATHAAPPPEAVGWAYLPNMQPQEPPRPVLPLLTIDNVPPGLLAATNANTDDADEVVSLLTPAIHGAGGVRIGELDDIELDEVFAQ